MSDVLYVREDGSAWLIYLFGSMLLVCNMLFAVWVFRGVLLFRDRRELIRLAEADQMSKSVSRHILSSLSLRVIILAFGIAGLWIFLQDTFSGFTRVHLREDVVVLGYLWPFPNKEVPRQAIQSVQLENWGKHSMRIRISLAGRTYHSVSSEPEKIREIRDTFPTR